MGAFAPGALIDPGAWPNMGSPMNHKITQLSRRAVMTAVAGIPVAGRAAGKDSNTLVAYFSRSGNTRVVAGLIQRKLGAEEFEIQPATPYPEDYLETVAQATQ